MKQKPYIRYSVIRGESPENIILEELLELRSKDAAEIFIQEIYPDIYDNCSTITYFPNGRHDSAPFIYFGSQIQFFKNKILPRLKCQKE